MTIANHAKSTKQRTMITAAAVVALTLSLSACTNGDPSSPEQSVDTTHRVTSDTAAVGDLDACTHVDTPMLDIPTAGDSEPQMRIPLPPGWERSNRLDNVDEVIRFTLAKTEPVADRPPQNVAVVTLALGPDVDAQTLLDDARAGLVEILESKDLPTNFGTTAATVCGLPGQTLTFTDAPVGLGTTTRPGKALQLVAKSGGQAYLIGVMTTAAADNATAQRDVETILAGFQVLPPRREHT